MSLSRLNSPPLVAGAGAALMIGLPWLEGLAKSSWTSLAMLRGANLIAYAVNFTAVSIPGRLDGQQDQAMRSGNLNPDQDSIAKEQTPLVGEGGGGGGPNYMQVQRSRTLLLPSGWAFAIWAPIYLGEAVFVGCQLFGVGGLDSVLPDMTAGFVTANLMQSLWCASFRPKYITATDAEGGAWAKYISVAMLLGTAASLSQVHAVACSPHPDNLALYFLPMSLHFGWTTAATLVNLNGSIAQDTTSPRVLTAFGHGSAVLGTALGVALTLQRGAPVYGLTLAWALAACADGMRKRPKNNGDESSSSAANEEALNSAANVQKLLCWAGSAICALSSLYTAYW